MTTYGDVLKFIRSCKSAEDLRCLNKEVVAGLRNLQRELASTFRPGDKVGFTVSGKKDWKQNGEWTGTVTKVAGKAVRVMARKKGSPAGGPGMEWRVGPSVLREVK